MSFPPARAFAVLLRVLALAVVVAGSSLLACSVPVFRYALEKWPPDSYRATVFHRGPLTQSQQKLALDLSRDGLAGRVHANVSVETVDLAVKPDAEALELWRQLNVETLPWLVVRYPLAARRPEHVVSGPLSEATVNQLLGSAARKEITRRLAQGDSAVWVLLEIGDAKRDDETAKLVETRLAYLAGVLKLPAIDPQDVASGLVTVPTGGLKLAFSVVRMSRSDPAEATFVKMLLGTEPDLAEIKEPLLFPVFGQGRALYALAGKGIRDETLDEAATFLTGKCSCQVKELNPGVDLLLAADWGRMVKAQLGATPKLPPPAELAPVTVTITGNSDKPTEASGGAHPLPADLVLAVSCAVAGLLGAYFWLKRK